MKYKCTVAGIVVALACLAGWLANTAEGQPEPQRSAETSQPAAPSTQTPGAQEAKPDLAPTKEETDLIRAYQQRYAAKTQPAASNPQPAASNPSPPALTPPTLTTPGADSPKPPSTPPASPAPRAYEPAIVAQQFQPFVKPQAEAQTLDTAGTQANDNPSGRQDPAVSLEWIGPQTAKLGQPATYQVFVKNISSTPVTQVIVRVRIPTGLTVQATEPKALQEATTLIWDLGTMQPHHERRLDMQLLPDAKGDLACTALVTFTGTSSTRIRVREPKLELKAAGPDKVLLGDTATVTLTASNPGDGSADHVKIRAALTDGFEHTRGKMIEFDLGNLGPNESRSVQLVCGTKAPGTQTCEAVATADGGLHSQSAVKVDVILPKLDIIARGPKLRYLERHAIYTFKVSNPGSAPASNVIVSDVIPDGFKFLSASDGGRHELATRTVSWFVGDLTPGQSREVSVEVVAVNTGVHKHLATVVATRGLKNETEVLTRVEGLSALLMELVDLDDPVEVGADTAYEIRITNTGSKMESNLQLICTVPDKMEFRGAKGPTDSHFKVQGKEVVFEALPKLAPRADAIYRVNVRGTAPGDLRFRARVTADGVIEPLLKEESTKVYGDDVIK